MVTSKKALRISMLRQRNLLSQEHVKFKSLDIHTHLMQSEAFSKAETVFFYYPLGNEVSTLTMIEETLACGKIVALPRVINTVEMKFYQILSLDDVCEGTFHVFEPTGSKEVVYDQHTLIIVPCVAFDTHKYRLGFGAGYYDRYFSSILRDAQNTRIHSIGLGYTFQRVDSIYKEIHDIPLSDILTEVGFI